MDQIEKELRARFRKHLREGDVIPFPTKKQGPSLADKIAKMADDLPQEMLAQEEAEKEAHDAVHSLYRRAASQKKKFHLPFIMKNYQDDTSPIEAILWTVSEYLERGEAEYSYTTEQLRFTYQFLEQYYDEMLAAVKQDIEAATMLKKKIMNMPIPLPHYAATPADSLIFMFSDIKRRLDYFRMYDGIFAHPERQSSRVQVKNLDALFEDVNVMTQPFDRTSTGLPSYDDMLRIPEYFEKEKGIIFMIQDMSPQEYIQRAQEGFAKHHDYHGDILDTRNNRLAKEYAQKMLDGETFPMPYLDYTNLSFEQEGLHRAMAAMIAGVPTMPVMVVDNTSERKQRIRKQQESGSWW